MTRNELKEFQLWLHMLPGVIRDAGGDFRCGGMYLTVGKEVEGEIIQDDPGSIELLNINPWGYAFLGDVSLATAKKTALASHTYARGNRTTSESTND